MMGLERTEEKNYDMATVAKKRSTKIPPPETIRAIRGSLTQAEAAEKIGVSQSVWSAWERGAKVPSRQSALLLELLRRKKL